MPSATRTKVGAIITSSEPKVKPQTLLGLSHVKVTNERSDSSIVPATAAPSLKG